jgi:two-component sensor histidine kinase
VESLATLHRLLHQRAWEQVTLEELARQVIQTVVDALPYNQTVHLTVTPSPVMVTSRQASSLALIISELATNTIKYGLADRTEVTIRVTIEVEDNGEETVRVEYRDDGPGYPESVLNQAEAGSMGLQLIRQLAADLGGELCLANDGGAVARLRIRSE